MYRPRLSCRTRRLASRARARDKTLSRTAAHRIPQEPESEYVSRGAGRGKKVGKQKRNRALLKRVGEGIGRAGFDGHGGNSSRFYQANVGTGRSFGRLTTGLTRDSRPDGAVTNGEANVIDVGRALLKILPSNVLNIGSASACEIARARARARIRLSPRSI